MIEAAIFAIDGTLIGSCEGHAQPCGGACASRAIDPRQGALFKIRHLSGVAAFPGVRDLFERLRDDGVKRVLGSSGKPADVEQAEAIAGISGLVDAVASSED